MTAQSRQRLSGLPGLRAAAVRATDRCRDRRLEHKPALAAVDRLILGWPGFAATTLRRLRIGALGRGRSGLRRSAWSLDATWGAVRALLAPATDFAPAKLRSRYHVHMAVTALPPIGFAFGLKFLAANTNLIDRRSAPGQSGERKCGGVGWGARVGECAREWIRAASVPSV